MQKYNYYRILLFHICCLFFIGLWTLFSKGLPKIEDYDMLSILPQLFPLIISAIFLFLLPLLHPKKKFIYGGIIVLTMALLILNSSQLFQANYASVRLPLILLIAANLIFGIFYSIKLRSK